MDTVLNWLQGERVEGARQASVLILKELAQNAPSIFYKEVAHFFDAIWHALSDPVPRIR